MGRVYITPVKGRYILSRNRTVIVWDGLKLDDIFWVINFDQEENLGPRKKRLHEKALLTVFTKKKWKVILNERKGVKEFSYS